MESHLSAPFVPLTSRVSSSSDPVAILLASIMPTAPLGSSISAVT